MSGFFSNPRGVWDSYAAFWHYLARAGAEQSSTQGAGVHDHPWHYYLAMLAFWRLGPGPWWSEGFILILALAGLWASLSERASSRVDMRLRRFIAFYTGWMILLYSAIPYKTPWCMLGFLHGLILLAGIGAECIWRATAGRRAIRGAALLAMAAGTTHLAWQSERATGFFAADIRNPYVYAHTSPDTARFARQLDSVAAVQPEILRQPVLAMALEYWPLPWYLRRFEQVGYWHSVPEGVELPAAPVVIADVAFEETLRQRLPAGYFMDYFGLRHELLLCVMYRQDVWDRFIESRQAATPPEGADAMEQALR
ncbi:MAG: hypothetical protein BWZ10_03002 [candidate division BRC1 bacterium ADurb.BinA364]|nr:MAG: hypothetical protein BWZ10_03002 [candidate division BRC1 bacterium ADurb.BinA364]